VKTECVGQDNDSVLEIGGRVARRVTYAGEQEDERDHGFVTWLIEPGWPRIRPFL
jgi:hypothetical protein